MYDTINLKLGVGDIGDVDLLGEIPCYLNDISEHIYGNDCVYIIGKLDNLKVSVSRHQIKVKDGSISKWYLGDNLQTMGRGDIKGAVEKLSDTLHLPIDKATITRMDIAHNFIVKHPVDTYFNHLGVLTYAKRLREPYTLYYDLKDSRLAFYDKVKEIRSKGEALPELYQGKNVLRYEQRYLSRLPQHLNVPEVTASMLYDESFYMSLLDRWHSMYKDINKINDININFTGMKSKKELYKRAVLSYVESAGGQLAMIEQISEAYKRGELSGKQAHDLKNAINEACKVGGNLTTPNDAIIELDKKVKDAIKFYR